MDEEQGGVALVTGAASGIGRATALAFAARTCPKCAKHYGKNQIVLFAQVE